MVQLWGNRTVHLVAAKDWAAVGAISRLHPANTQASYLTLTHTHSHREAVRSFLILRCPLQSEKGTCLRGPAS